VEGSLRFAENWRPKTRHSLTKAVLKTTPKYYQSKRYYGSGRATREAFDSAKNHKRQRRKRQSVTAKREKSQTPKFV